MLDHFVFKVPKARFEEVVTWYLAALAPLSYTKQFDHEGQACGLGPSKDAATFWIGVSEEPAASGGFHVAFKANSHDDVDRFYEEAVKAGGKGNGEPGPREMYGPHYYGAFVMDPMGNNIEVVDKSVVLKDEGYPIGLK